MRTHDCGKDHMAVVWRRGCWGKDDSGQKGLKALTGKRQSREEAERDSRCVE